MKKTYVLDTNVLIQDPRSIFAFEDNDVYIPVYCIEELDKIKSESTLRGKSSREVCRILDELRCSGNFKEGIRIGEGRLFIYVPKDRVGIEVALEKNMDSLILQSAIEIGQVSAYLTIFVTMDVNLRIRADVLGMQTETYENQEVKVTDEESSVREVWLEDGSIDRMYQLGSIEMPNGYKDLGDNSSIMIKETGSGRGGIGRYYKGEGRIKVLNIPKSGVMGISAKSKEQSFAIDLLLDDKVKLVILSGKSGTGKTLLTCAVGLHKILNEGIYSRMIISKPVVPVGKDVGYLPGLLEEKMSPWMQPFFDNIEYLMMSKGKKRSDKFKKRDEYDRQEGDPTHDSLIESGMVKMEPLTFMRGRSIPNQFIVLDETQNTNIHELKTLVTRCGEGTKLVLLGDSDQIDSPYLNKANCGLSIGIGKFADNAIVGHVHLEKGERSELATLATFVL